MEVVNESKVPRVGCIDFLRLVRPALRKISRLRLTLSVAIFIHSSKFARMGILFIGVTAAPATCIIAPSSCGVRGLAPTPESRFLTGVAAALIEFI